MPSAGKDSPEYRALEAQILQRRGLDPSKTTIDLDTGEFVPRIGVLGALSRSGVANIPTVVESVLGARAGRAAGARAGLALGARFGPWGAGIGALAGALGLPAALAGPTQRFREKIMSPEFEANLAQAQKQHPIATEIGAQLSALPFFGFTSGQMFKDALKRNPQALAELGLGAGVGAAIPIAQDVAAEEPINPMRALVGAVGNVGLARPRAITRALAGLPRPASQQPTTPPIESAEAAAPEGPTYAPEVYDALRELGVDAKSGEEVAAILDPAREHLAKNEAARTKARNRVRAKIATLKNSLDLASNERRPEIEAAIADLERQHRTMDIAEVLKDAIEEARTARFREGMEYAPMETEGGVPGERTLAEEEGSGKIEGPLPDTPEMARIKQLDAEVRGTDRERGYNYIRRARGESDPMANKELEKTLQEMVPEGTDPTIYHSFLIPAPSKFGPKDKLRAPKRIGLNPFRGEAEKLRRGGPAQAQMADAVSRLDATFRGMLGRYQNPILRALESLPSDESRNKVYETIIDERRAGKSLAAGLSPQEAAAYTTIRDTLKLMQREAAHQPVQLSGGKTRPRGQDPFYGPMTIDQQIGRILAEGQGTPEFAKLKQEFIAYQLANRLSAAEAEKRFRRLLGTFEDVPGQSAFDFRGVRLPEGIGLPDSWIETNPVRAFRHYTRAFARDRAFYDVMEQNPELMAMLGHRTYAANKPIPPNILGKSPNLVRDPHLNRLLTSYIGGDIQQDPIWSGLGRFVNSMILGGPVTKLTDLATVPIKAAAYVAPGHEDDIISGIGQWRKGFDNAFDTGFNRRGGLVVAQDVLGMGEAASGFLNKAAEFITKYTGSEHLELASRGLSQSIGEFIGETHRTLAKQGDADSLRFLGELGSDWQTISREELGTRIGQLMQGKYNLTNLPSWMTNSHAAPFLTMMRWSVEQLNNFERFVVEPARQGNWTPFVYTVIGGLGGGLAISALRELVGGRKQYAASWEELSEAEDSPGYIDALTYKLMTAAQVTGTAGIMSEFLKQAYEKMTGRMPQGFRYPVWEVGEDIGARITAAVRAMNEGEDWQKILPELLKDIGTRHVQMGRIIYNQYGKFGDPKSRAAEDIRRANQRRDLSVFERLHGIPQPTMIEAPPSYSRLTEREFDRASVEDAQRLLPQLVRRAVDRAQGNPELIASELRKLRTIDVQGMPNPDTLPLRFVQYHNWVRRTQGSEAAQKLLVDYLTRQAQAQAKREVVPR